VPAVPEGPAAALAVEPAARAVPEAVAGRAVPGAAVVGVARAEAAPAAETDRDGGRFAGKNNDRVILKSPVTSKIHICCSRKRKSFPLHFFYPRNHSAAHFFFSLNCNLVARFALTKQKPAERMIVGVSRQCAARV
jgi:hypothetical protein